MTLQQQKIVCAVASKIRLTDTELLELNIKGYYAELRKVIRSLQTQVITIDKIIDNEVRSVDIYLPISDLSTQIQMYFIL